MLSVFNNQGSVSDRTGHRARLRLDRGLLALLCLTRSLLVLGIASVMLLPLFLPAEGSQAAERSETESPLNESSEENTDLDETLVRHSKLRKIRLYSAPASPVAAHPECCYQQIRFIRGHLLENGLVAPLLC